VGSNAMSSAGASPARTSALPVRELALQARGVGSGGNTTDSFASFDLGTSSSKMSQPSSVDLTDSAPRLTAAYVAGLIDGEGCLWIQNKSNRWFTPRCDIGMTIKARPILEKLKAQYGGSLGSHRKATKEWEAALRWAVSGQDCRRMLEEIAPHLILKAEQARLLMAVTNENGLTHKALVSELNQKGPSTTPEAGWFARHVGDRWLTPQRDLASSHGWGEFSETWPRSGMTRSGTAYRLPTLVPLTGEIESGLLPTPTADKCVASEPTPEMAERFRRKGSSGSFVEAMAARIWATPTSRDFRHPGRSRMERTGSKAGECLPQQIGGALNPTWVEWLMGFPLGWTVLEHWVTRSSRKSSKLSGER
jgi:hypothetical protein